MRLGVRDRLYGQVEFLDGTLGPVVEFRGAQRTVEAQARNESLAQMEAAKRIAGQPAAPANVPVTVTMNVHGSWAFRPQAQPLADPVMMLTITPSAAAGSSPAIVVKGDGIHGTGQFRGTVGSINIATPSGAVAAGTLAFDSGGTLHMTLTTHPGSAIPSGRFIGTRR
jgi:hypothetical protein